jgi:hypothetical protein
MFVLDRILNQMKPGARAAVFLVEHTISKEKYVLKSSFIEEAAKRGFKEQMDCWKGMCSICTNIVSFKEFFFVGQNACLVS